MLPERKFTGSVCSKPCLRLAPSPWYSFTVPVPYILMTSYSKHLSLSAQEYFLAAGVGLVHAPGRLKMLEKFLSPGGSSQPWWMGVNVGVPKLPHSSLGTILKHVLYPLPGSADKTEPE